MKTAAPLLAPLLALLLLAAPAWANLTVIDTAPRWPQVEALTYLGQVVQIPREKVQESPGRYLPMSREQTRAYYAIPRRIRNKGLAVVDFTTGHGGEVREPTSDELRQVAEDRQGREQAAQTVKTRIQAVAGGAPLAEVYAPFDRAAAEAAWRRDVARALVGGVP